MKSYKIISIIVLFLAVFGLLIVPMEEGSFPSWINTDLMQFLLIVLMTFFVVVLAR